MESCECRVLRAEHERVKSGGLTECGERRTYSEEWRVESGKRKAKS